MGVQYRAMFEEVMKEKQREGGKKAGRGRPNRFVSTDTNLSVNHQHKSNGPRTPQAHGGRASKEAGELVGVKTGRKRCWAWQKSLAHPQITKRFCGNPTALDRFPDQQENAGVETGPEGPDCKVNAMNEKGRKPVNRGRAVRASGCSYRCPYNDWRACGFFAART